MGQSLSDKIYTGPDILFSLFGVFLRFFEGRIAMAADAKEIIIIFIIIFNTYIALFL